MMWITNKILTLFEIYSLQLISSKLHPCVVKWNTLLKSLIKALIIRGKLEIFSSSSNKSSFFGFSMILSTNNNWDEFGWFLFGMLNIEIWLFALATIKIVEKNKNRNKIDFIDSSKLQSRFLDNWSQLMVKNTDFSSIEWILFSTQTDFFWKL